MGGIKDAGREGVAGAATHARQAAALDPTGGDHSDGRGNSKTFPGGNVSLVVLCDIDGTIALRGDRWLVATLHECARA
jgi:hypothetical protein